MYGLAYTTRQNTVRDCQRAAEAAQLVCCGIRNVAPGDTTTQRRASSDVMRDRASLVVSSTASPVRRRTPNRLNSRESAAPTIRYPLTTAKSPSFVDAIHRHNTFTATRRHPPDTTRSPPSTANPLTVHQSPFIGRRLSSAIHRALSAHHCQITVIRRRHSPAQHIHRHPAKAEHHQASPNTDKDPQLAVISRMVTFSCKNDTRETFNVCVKRLMFYHRMWERKPKQESASKQYESTPQQPVS
jgi:hypothetical protein